MSIIDLRTEFKQLSGLIALSNVECDKWINRGIRFLDLSANFPFSHGRQAQLVQAGQYQVDFQAMCRVIESVWVVNLQGVIDPLTNIAQIIGRTRVKLFIDPNKFKIRHPNLSGETGSTPIEAAITVPIGVDTLSIPGGLANYDQWVETKAVGAPIADGSFYADGSIMADAKIQGNVRGLLFAPPADHEYMLEIFGKFFSVQLTDAIPDNQWSINYPDTVMAAALYKLQLIKYRNTEGAKDYLVDVTSTLSLLDRDSAEEDADIVDKMLDKGMEGGTFDGVY